jgi:hypothetical protein
VQSLEASYSLPRRSGSDVRLSNVSTHSAAAGGVDLDLALARARARRAWCGIWLEALRKGWLQYWFIGSAAIARRR